MADDYRPDVEVSRVRDRDEPDSVVVHQNLFDVVARAVGSATALALAALIAATATMLNMSVADDLADAKLYSSRGFNNLEALRWATGIRLAVAVIGFLLAMLAGFRYSRELPATRYTFSADGEEATESIEGVEPRPWVGLLVGSAIVVSILATLLNAAGLAWALHLHESPNFGLPG